MDGALEHQKEGKKNLIFFWFFAMMSSFQGCFEVDFGFSLERVLCHVYGRFVVSIGAGLSSVERVVFEMGLGRKTACTRAPKVPRARNCVGSTLLRWSLFM